MPVEQDPSSAIDHEPISATETVPSDPALERLIRLSVALGLLAFALLAPSRFRFWFDSWTYHELSQSVGRDFYRVSTVREFERGSPYSSAFPPLWPAIIATLSFINSSIFTMYAASVLSLAAAAAATEHFARRLFDQRGTGLLAVLLLLAFPGIRWDVGGGGTMALHLCLVALAGSLFLRLAPSRTSHALGIGILAGLMAMLRFDALPAALVTLVAGAMLGLRGRRLLIMLAAFAVVVSPWIIYSWSHFHTPFATDNRAVALALDPDAYVMDFHPGPTPTLGDDPVRWLGKLGAHAPVVARSLLDAMLRSVFLLPLVALAVAMFFFDGARRRAAPATARSALRRASSRPALALAAVVLAPMAAYLVTGYQESRYFSPFLWLGELLALGIALAYASPTARRTIVVLACLAGVGKSVALARYLPVTNPLSAMRAQLQTGTSDSVVACLRRAGASPSDGVLFAFVPRHLDAYRFGATTGWRASPTPRNWMSLTPAERLGFAQRFRLGFVLDVDPSGPDRIPTTPVPGCAQPLHRVSVAP